MKSLKFIFIFIAFSVLEVYCNEVQEVIAVPPRNYTKPRYSIKIVGGSPAREHQFPWQASVTSCSEKSCLICGGSLISRRYVLTAAHCTAGLSEFQIGVGSTDRNRPAFSVFSYGKIEHPQYNPEKLFNDIAILKLPRPIRFIKGVETIKLARNNVSYTNQNATLSGYGKTSSSGPVSDKLNFVDMRIISNQECANEYSIVRNTTLCALGRNRSVENACQGDSGGPLVVKERSSFVQVGIVSFVAKVGCEYGYPSGYARVSSFYKWIANNTDLN
uniref:Cul n 11 allergen n=1 Tax=Culicoides nubeculosus TaxID=144565 RepID=D9IL21_CULNU|nr:Cul n 11 allergen [Culicoides nubeculosus]